MRRVCQVHPRRKKRKAVGAAAYAVIKSRRGKEISPRAGVASRQCFGSCADSASLEETPLKRGEIDESRRQGAHTQLIEHQQEECAEHNHEGAEGNCLIIGVALHGARLLFPRGRDK